ncbi:hypothetical protein [Fructobacillus cardui]|uniref:hypothetical protein n=1 Tax=Fructobacillus cardui TaxID=2893170 RepID=UPI002DB18694|nr:hypothetical protein R53653_IHELHDKM_00722 [Fructobacillus cardui]
MAIDTKKLSALLEASKEELKQVEKLGGLEKTAELQAEMKKDLGMEDELAEVSPMLPSYLSTVNRNLVYLLGAYRSTATHAKNRSKEFDDLQGALSKVKKV